MPDMILLAIKHGLRVNEVASLQWKDVVFESNHIMLWDRKSGRKEAFRMAKAVAEMLKRRKAAEKTRPKTMFSPAPEW